MENYKIGYNGDTYVENIHHIGVEYNGNYYSVIFGEYVNGGFFSIPNWNCGGELAGFSDVFWNTESIQRSLKSKKTARVIAQAIADYIKDGEQHGTNKRLCNKEKRENRGSAVLEYVRY